VWWLGYGTQLSIHPGPAVRAWVHCQACKGTGLRSGTTGLALGHGRLPWGGAAQLCSWRGLPAAQFGRLKLAQFLSQYIAY
jgi:hypothetical protein